MFDRVRSHGNLPWNASLPDLTDNPPPYAATSPDRRACEAHYTRRDAIENLARSAPAALPCPGRSSARATYLRGESCYPLLQHGEDSMRRHVTLLITLATGAALGL